MKKVFFIPLLMLVYACSTEGTMEQTDSSSEPFKYHETSHHPSHPGDSSANPFQGRAFKSEAYKTDTLGWGYVILIDGKKTINQPHIPGIQGLKGFRTEEDALKTANLVVYKLQHNQLPPSISPKELDSLGIKY